MEFVLVFLRDYITFVFSTKLIEYSVLQLVFGWIPIMTYLVKTGHASFEDDHLSYSEAYKVRCADKRWVKDLVVLGGPAALAFGITSRLIALVAEVNGWALIADWCNANARLRFYLSAFNMIFLIARLIAKREEIARHKPRFVKFESHLFGCGHITGAGAFWPLYWIQMILVKLKWGWAVRLAVIVRDIDTIISWIISCLLTWPILTVITIQITGKYMLYGMVSERPQKH